MGQGSSMVLSEEAWTLFSTVSPKFLFVPDSHLQMNTLALMDPDELVLFFSYSGSTRDFQDLLEVARQRQVKVVLVSRFPKSPGGQLADVVLQCGADEGRSRPAPSMPGWPSSLCWTCCSRSSACGPLRRQSRAGSRSLRPWQRKHL